MICLKHKNPDRLSTTTEPAAPNVPSSHRRLFVNTYLVTTLNPKGIVFYVAFLPQFVNPSSSVTRQLWILAVTFVTMGIVNVTLYATFAGSARRLLASPHAQRRFNIAGGSMLSGAGVWTLLAKRPR
jgi:threonine/homoserine/homoserine lactone efflux protein